MKVMAVDPSINNIGWAIADNGNIIDSGLIKTKGKTNGEKLSYLYDALIRISRYFAVDKPLKKAYIDKTLYKGLGKSIQNIFKFAKAIGFIEFFFTHWKIPIEQPSRKLARKLNAITSASLFLVADKRYSKERLEKLTTHEAEAIVWALFYSREVEHGT